MTKPTPPHFTPTTSKLDAQEQRLKQAYAESKAQHPLPAALKTKLLQQVNQRSAFPFSWPVQVWFRQVQFVLGSICLAILGFLLLQPVSIPSYQIAITYQNQPFERENHRLTMRSLPAVVAQFSNDEQQQRYQQMVAAQRDISQFHAEYGVLQKVQQEWQITVCDKIAVTLDDALLQQLKMFDATPSVWQTQQQIAFYRGAQGQLVAIKPADNAQLCPVS